ncbi:MAG: DnaJ domain-containing protein [Bryobacteraceae bacterium]|nr:DnaJ domain-containing protein [Bryobacteraceae bacterium]
MRPAKERRKHPRKSITETQLLHLTGVGSRRLTLKVVDCGPDGVGAELIEPLGVGAILTLHGDLTQSGVTRTFRDQRVRVVSCSEVRTGVYRAGFAFTEASAPKPATSATSVNDYYEVLQVHEKASADTIHRVYRILAQRYHPDNPETGDESVFRQVLEAYNVLSDPEQRAAYDVQLGSYQRHKWKIFDKPEAARGLDGEKSKRKGILSLLYTKRVTAHENPSLNLHELEDMLSVPREHLEFSLWYLREQGWIQRADNGRYVITAKGVDQAEESGAWTPRQDHLLEAANVS